MEICSQVACTIRATATALKCCTGGKETSTHCHLQSPLGQVVSDADDDGGAAGGGGADAASTLVKGLQVGALK